VPPVRHFCGFPRKTLSNTPGRLRDIRIYRRKGRIIAAQRATAIADSM